MKVLNGYEIDINIETDYRKKIGTELGVNLFYENFSYTLRLKNAYHFSR